MLVKEYRILLPLTVQEYQIAQLYMIQKKSRVDTSGAGSGVEIIKNEPYNDGPGGKGQYTHKIFHIGSHLPVWFRSILPKSALTVEEEAWNAYPYTKTRYTCPFVERFLLEVETMYFNDPGCQENVFNLSRSELDDRVVDVMDIVKDAISVMDYSKEEDPKLFKSAKTGRGPLGDDWVQDCVANKKAIMCAYKVCRVEFRYWGMQTRIEKFIHDIALRKTMLRAHRQAWAWLDEWWGLSINDIRKLEEETKRVLSEKMAKALEAEGLSPTASINAEMNSVAATGGSGSNGSENNRADENRDPAATLEDRRKSYATDRSVSISANAMNAANYRLEGIRSDSDDSETEFFDAAEHLDDPVGQVNMVRWSSNEMLQLEDDGTGGTPSDPYDQSFFGGSGSTSTACPTSLLIIVFHGGSVFDSTNPYALHSSLEQLPTTPVTPNSERTTSRGGGGFFHSSSSNTTKSGDIQTLRTTLDAVVSAHYPQLVSRMVVRLVSCPPICRDALNLMASLSPYGRASNQAGEFGTHPSTLPILACNTAAYDDIVNCCVTRANLVYKEFMQSEEGQGFHGEIFVLGDAMGGLIAYDALAKGSTSRRSVRTSSQVSARSDVTDISATIVEDDENLDNTSMCEFALPKISTSSINENGNENDNLQKPAANVRSSRSKSDESGDVFDDKSLTQSCPVKSLKKGASRMQSMPYKQTEDASAATERTRVRSNSLDNDPPPTPPPLAHISATPHRLRANSTKCHTLNFTISELFLLGSPIALLLAQRRLQNQFSDSPPGPQCRHVHNLFYATDPCSFRVEPLLFPNFSAIAPVNVPRYHRFPLGDRQSVHLFDSTRNHLAQLNIKQYLDSDSIHEPAWNAFQLISSRWWGGKRVDYALYCPEALGSFPAGALPSLLHASFWESHDLAAFIIRQFASEDFESTVETQANGSTRVETVAGQSFVPLGPTEKWKNRRTIIKRRNLTANHRANDVIVAEGNEQILVGRFMYGPLDVVALGGETVDIYAGPEPDSTGGDFDWKLMGSEVTDSHGRLSFRIPNEKRLGEGVHAIKMVVRGDHTYLDMYLAVLPPSCNCVVFSIDGSFAASVSVTAKDPKVRAGAVDVVRHWQDLGYLVLYVTARPDMQQRRVVAWLSQHNFPSGLLFFSDGISTDPLKQKTSYLKHAINNCGAVMQAGYGSAKDVHVYSCLSLPPERIFVVGKVSKKIVASATPLYDGYAQHLFMLQSGALQTIACPASGNGRMIIRKGCFGVPGQLKGLVQRSQSFTPRTGKYYMDKSGLLKPANLSVPTDIPGRNSDTESPSTPPTSEGLPPKASRGLSPLRLVRRVSFKKKTKD